MAAQETTNPKLEALIASLKESQDKTTSAVISSDASVQSLNSQIDSIGKSIVNEIGTSISVLQSAMGNIKNPEFDTSSISQAIGNIDVSAPPHAPILNPVSVPIGDLNIPPPIPPLGSKPVCIPAPPKYLAACPPP